MSIVAKKKKEFSKTILSGYEARIGFVDVGSGGPLKAPWCFVDNACMETYAIEPTGTGSGKLPLCISNRIGKSKFYVAHDERGSSLHEPLPAFAKRFGQDSILTKKMIEVELSTLDQLFIDNCLKIDAIDINTEGHDFQVLQGAVDILEEGVVKLIKVEFELTGVWKNQGWFGDIDSLCRSKGYELIKMEIDSAKPVNVKDISHPGEPLWGKAYYSPSPEKWKKIFSLTEHHKKESIKAAVLYTLADVPGKAFDVLDLTADMTEPEKEGVKKQIKNTLRFNILQEAKSDAVRFLKMPLRIIKYFIK